MKQTLRLASFCAALGLALLHAESPPVVTFSPPAVRINSLAADDQNQTVSPRKQLTLEIQGEKIADVLRSLARRAGRSLFVDNQVIGTVAIHLESRTPLEAIETLVSAEDLKMEERNGVLIVRSKHPLPPGAEEKAPEPAKPADDLATAFIPMLTGLFDSMLDYAARPETAQKIAKGKKTLYDACLAEGFTKDEAFRLTLAGHELPFSEMAK